MLFPPVLVLLATASGPGIGVDSVSYAAAAQSWARDLTLITYNGDSLTIFPPGFPMFLGSVMVLGVPMSAAAIGINILSLIGLVSVTFFIGRLVLRDECWAVLGSLVLASSIVVIQAHAYLWTEPIFSLLVALIIWILVRALRQRQATWLNIAALGILIGLASAVRFVGIIMIPIALVVIWIGVREERFRKLLGVLVLSGFFPLAVVLRSVLLGDGPFGDRYPGSLTWEGAVSQLVLQWGEVLAPSRTTSLTMLAGVVVGILLVSGAWLSVIQRNQAGLLLSAIVVIYWVAIIVSQTGTRLDVDSSRFGIPIASPSIILVLIALRGLVNLISAQLAAAQFFSQPRARLVSLTTLFVIGGLIGGLAIFHSIRFAIESRSAGLGLASIASEERALTRIAREQPESAVIASNDPWSVWWARGGGVVLDFPPSEQEWPTERIVVDVQRLVKSTEPGEDVIAIVDDEAGSTASAEVLSQFGINLEPVEAYDGISISRVMR